MRRFFRFVIYGMLLLITFTPTFADALPYNAIVYGPLTSTKDGVQTIEVGVVAFGRYDAAMVALGYDGDFIHGLSSDQTALLSNQATGGDFWKFAQNFSLAPNDDLMTLQGITWKSLNALYGYGNVQRGVYTQGEAANAKRDLLKILTDGSLGGGSGGGDDDYLVFAGNLRYINWGSVGRSVYWVKDGGTYCTTLKGVHDRYGYEMQPVPITVKIPKSSSVVSSFIEKYPDTSKYIMQFSYSGGELQLYIYSKNYTLTDGTNFTDDWVPEAMRGTPTYTRVVYDNAPYIMCNSKRPNYTFDGYTITLASSSTFLAETTTTRSLDLGGSSCVIKADSGVAGPVIPPSNWPTAPDEPAPTAPEVPTPTEPDLPTQPSTPTAPSLPDFPSYVIAPGTTYETFDIQAILDAMDEHCQHIQSAVYQGFSDYFDTFTPWLRDEFSTLRTFLREEDDWIVESISDEFMELRSYLKELAEWLADQMDFTITGGDYDDSTVVSWLKKIYYKLGGASVNTKPVDPVGDPDGSWDWLNQLIEGILSALAGGAANLAGSLGDLFQGINDKFPFSIPWDIVAIVALLDAPPVTPEAVIEYDVFGAHVRYDIDLHFFDEQAAVIRAMENVLFCAFLLFKTNWLNGIFDGIGDFLGGKLKSTVKSP